MSKRNVALALFLGVCVISTGLTAARGAETKGAATTPRSIPGLTAKDDYPHACVDCHAARPAPFGDMRLSAFFQRMSAAPDQRILGKLQALAPKKLTGKHPPISATIKDVPSKCLPCHAQGSKIAPPFPAMMHVLHLTGGSTFLATFGGECTHCHKLNAQTGVWAVPSAGER